jgi:hypothetical protein
MAQIAASHEGMRALRGCAQAGGAGGGGEGTGGPEGDAAFLQRARDTVSRLGRQCRGADLSLLPPPVLHGSAQRSQLAAPVLSLRAATPLPVCWPGHGAWDVECEVACCAGAGSKVLVVTHRGLLSMVHRAAVGHDHGGQIANGSVSEVLADDDRLAVLAWNVDVLGPNCKADAGGAGADYY